MRRGGSKVSFRASEFAPPITRGAPSCRDRAAGDVSGRATRTRLRPGAILQRVCDKRCGEQVRCQRVPIRWCRNWKPAKLRPPSLLWPVVTPAAHDNAAAIDRFPIAAVNGLCWINFLGFRRSSEKFSQWKTLRALTKFNLFSKCRKVLWSNFVMRFSKL
jgi:hypothetical protein